MIRVLLATGVIAVSAYSQSPARPRARDLGIAPGALTPGPLNAITDVAGVRVGQVTIVEGDKDVTGNGRTIRAIPIDALQQMLKKFGRGLR